MADRDWNKDGRVLNAEDAHQVVACYKASYSRRRFEWLMWQAAHHGHSPEVSAVFEKENHNA